MYISSFGRLLLVACYHSPFSFIISHVCIHFAFYSLLIHGFHSSLLFIKIPSFQASASWIINNTILCGGLDHNNEFMDTVVNKIKNDGERGGKVHTRYILHSKEQPFTSLGAWEAPQKALDSTAIKTPCPPARKTPESCGSSCA